MSKMMRSLVACVLAALLAPTSLAQFSLPTQGRKGPLDAPDLVLRNGASSLALATDIDLGIRLKSMGDGIERRAFTFAKRSLWRLQLLPTSASSLLDVIEIDASDCEFDLLLAKQGSVLHAWWRNVEIGHPSLPATSTAEVYVSARPNADGRTFDFDLDVQIDVPGHSLYAAGFQAWFEERGPNATQVLVTPRAGGLLLPAPGDSMAALQAIFGLDFVGLGDHPGLLSMQFTGYYNSAEANPALAYFATRDTEGYKKTIVSGVDTSGPERAIKWMVFQYPVGNTQANAFTSPTPFAIGTLRGDWYDASRHYREWALQQPWVADGKLDTSPEASLLLRNAKTYGVWTVPKCTPPVITPGAKPCPNIPDMTQVSSWTPLVDELHSYFGLDSSLGTITRFWDDNAHFNANWGEWFPLTPELLSELPNFLGAGHDFALYFAPAPYSTQAPGYSVPAPSDPNVVPAYATDVVQDFGRVDEFGQLFLDSTGGATGNCFKDLGCGTSADAGLIESIELCMQTDFSIQHGLHVLSQAVLQSGASGAFLDAFTNGKNELCYAPGHGHALGDGLDWFQRKIEYVTRIRSYIRGETQEGGSFISSPTPEFYFTSEGEQELFIGPIELTRRTRTGPPRDLAPGLPYTRLAPLFQTVYHGYQLAFDGRRAVSGPEDRSVHGSAFEMRYGRQHLAANLYFGHLPAGGLILSDELRGGTIASKLSYPYFELTMETMQNMLVVHREPSVREFMLFGDRMRDPEVTGVGTVKLEAVGDGSLTFGPFWPGVDPVQPFVYVNAHKRTGVDDEVGVGFMNWSATVDDTVSLPNLQPTETPGDQTFSYSIDPVEYGLPNGMYDIVEVFGGGSPDATIGTADFSAGQTQTFAITVPERSMRFLIFRPQ